MRSGRELFLLSFFFPLPSKSTSRYEEKAPGTRGMPKVMPAEVTVAEESVGVFPKSFLWTSGSMEREGLRAGAKVLMSLSPSVGLVRVRWESAGSSVWVSGGVCCSDTGGREGALEGARKDALDEASVNSGKYRSSCLISFRSCGLSVAHW